MRAALNALATAAPSWLASLISEQWCERYDQRADSYRLPKGDQAHAEHAAVMGRGRPARSRLPPGCAVLALSDGGRADPAQVFSKAQRQRPYQIRAGIEGIISQVVRGHGQCHSRYVELAKAHLQSVLAATAINLVRIDTWLTATPLDPTCTSHFIGLP
jgi:hypothetical protein